MNLVDLLQHHGLRPRRVSSAHGGEYVSACPVCGDGGKGGESDRFHVWPERATGGRCPGRFWCRQCGISGDPIEFVQRVDARTFVEACADLGIPLDNRPAGATRSRYQAAPALVVPDAAWEPRLYPEPAVVWQEQAAQLLVDCQERLHARPEALAWLAARGIGADAVRTYGLGYNESGRGRDRYRNREDWGLNPVDDQGRPKRLWIPRGWVIPCRSADGRLVQLRVRRLNEDVARFAPGIRYLPVDGSSMATMVLHPEAEVFVVVESGFDAVLLASVTGGRIGALTTWNSAARPDQAAHRLLAGCSCLLGGLDYDQGGDREQAWWQHQYRQYRRLAPLPNQAKDPGDAATAGADLYRWLVDGLPRPLAIRLGLVAARKAQTAPPEPQPEPVPAPEPEPPPVYELVLDDGTTVFLTNDKPTWQRLNDSGQPAFSENELARLYVALDGLSGEARAAAVRRVIEAKLVFGAAYVVRGRGPAAVPPGM